MVEWCAHRDFRFCREIDERHIDCDSEVVLAARSDVALTKKVREALK